MKSIFALVVAALLLVTFVQSETIYSDEVVVRDMKLFVGGKEFFVKGMAYNPAPLGILNMTADGYGGTGYCSAKKTVFGEYRSACFGSDYFDGVKAESTRVPPGPKDSSGKLEPFWQKVWDRDLAVIKGMGANAIRIYNLNPLTQTFLDMFPNEYDVTEPGRAAEHITFFDLCQKHGLKVIAPIVTDQTFITSNPEDLVNKHIDSEITEIGNHPALLMYTLGNEMPVFTDSSLLALVNKYMARVRSRQQAIWNRRIPVTHAIVDTPEVYEYLVEKLDVDLFTTNAGYRDIYMDPLWEGEGDFMGWTKLSQKYNMTLLIGEVGMHQEGDEITQARPDWFNQQWKAIVTRIPDGCIGGVFFEYNDEYQKGSAENGKDRHMGAMIPTVATQNGKTSLTADAWIPDEMVEKPIVFNSIKSGHPGSAFAEYNMNADVFKLIGRSQQSIAVVDRDSDNGGAGSDDGETRESSSATVAISAVALVVALVAAAL